VDSASCGVDTRTGYPADELAIRTAADKGVDLEKHRTTPIQSLEFEKGDLLVAMEPCQAVYINRLYGKEYRCSLLGLWGRPLSPYIHDPYGASVKYYSNCFDYIEKSIHEVVREIRKAGQH
jgi:protein-tyrosine-phosphatase